MPEARGRILVLFHANERPERAHEYCLWHCAPHWRAAGFTVATQFGVATPLEADVVVPQIDVSVLPDEYRRSLDAHPCVLNRGVTDIRKRGFSRNLVRLHDDYQGPVIVKTNANFGGRPELRLARSRSLLRRTAAMLGVVARRALPAVAGESLARLARTGTLDPNRYPIFPHKRDVPTAVFEDSSLVVERFRPEHVGGRFHVRSYVFLGDREMTIRITADAPVVKAACGHSPHEVPVDPRIVAERAALGLDYGKLDYVIHGDDAVLLDVNLTPCISRTYPRPAIARAVAPGIEAWLDASA